jgi:hypothetical protein
MAFGALASSSRGTYVGGVNGLLAGTIASAVMSGAMRVAQGLGAIERPPPATITERTLGTRGRAGSARNALQNTAAHLAFGAVMGLVFEQLPVRVARRLPTPLNGAVFALGVWAVSYEAALPMLRLLPPAHRDHPGRPATMIAAHLVYGTVLELLGQRRAAGEEQDRDQDRRVSTRPRLRQQLG